MIARGNVRRIVHMVGEMQNLIGYAHGNHQNDRDPDGFEKAQKALGEAFDLCVQIRGMYDPLPADRREEQKHGADKEVQ